MVAGGNVHSKVVVLFIDHDESFNCRYRWVKEDGVVFPVVIASKMVAYGVRWRRLKVAASMAVLSREG